MIEIVTGVFALIAVLFALVVFDARRSMAYVYCNATISAWESKLIPEQRMMELADTPSLSNIFMFLEDMDYKTQLASFRNRDVDVLKVERAFRENSNNRYRELIQMLPNERKKTVEMVLQRTDLWNLKTILTAIHNRMPVEKRLEELLPSPTMSREKLELLASAESFERLLEFLKGSEYFGALSTALKEYGEQGLAVLLIALDKHYYSSLWKDILSKRAQRSILKDIIGYEIDALNIKLAMRLKREKVPREKIDKLFIRPSYLLTDAMLESMTLVEDVRSIADAISHTFYGKLIAAAIHRADGSNSLISVEKALDEYHLKLCRWLALTKFFSVAPVLAYIYLKEAEARNLRTIVKLKSEGVEPQEIKEMLVGVPKIEL